MKQSKTNNTLQNSSLNIADVISRLYDKVVADTKADRSRVVAGYYNGRLSFYELDSHEEKVVRYLTTLQING